MEIAHPICTQIRRNQDSHWFFSESKQYEVNLS